MRIDPSSTGSAQIFPTGAGRRTDAQQRTSTSRLASKLSGQLSPLVERVAGADEIRQDKVELAREQLRSGAYSTREAAIETADAFLRLNDHAEM